MLNFPLTNFVFSFESPCLPGVTQVNVGVSFSLHNLPDVTFDVETPPQKDQSHAFLEEGAAIASFKNR